jgi:hypothetical protein
MLLLLLLLLGVGAAVADRAEAALHNGGAADVPAAPTVTHEGSVVQLAGAQEGQRTCNHNNGSEIGTAGCSGYCRDKGR